MFFLQLLLKTVPRTFRTSLPSALGQGSDDSSEGQLWPPTWPCTRTHGRPQCWPTPCRQPQADQEPVSSGVGVGVPLVSLPGQKHSGLIQGRGPFSIARSTSKHSFQRQSFCHRRCRKYPRERALSTGTGATLVTLSYSHEKGTILPSS